MFDPDKLPVEIVQILDENGNGDEEKLAAFSDEWLLRAYREMRRARVIDERLLRMQRQGRIGTYAPFSGQEAAQIGSALALRKDDWIFPSYREVAVCLMHGMPLEQVFPLCAGPPVGKADAGRIEHFPYTNHYRRTNAPCGRLRVGVEIERRIASIGCLFRRWRDVRGRFS